MNKERLQNIELLRIVCMFFIILFHINLNVILRNSETSEILNYVAICGNSIVSVAVNCFILISGYFGIKIKTKSFVGLLFQTEFYSVVVLAMAIFMGYTFVFPSGLIPFKPSGLWFIPQYIMLYLLSPILNQLVASKYLHCRSIVILLIISYIAYFIGKYQGYNVLNFILLYLTGRWLYLYPPDILRKEYGYI